jgi:hypothetical protein
LLNGRFERSAAIPSALSRENIPAFPDYLPPLLDELFERLYGQKLSRVLSRQASQKISSQVEAPHFRLIKSVDSKAATSEGPTRTLSGTLRVRAM